MNKRAFILATILAGTLLGACASTPGSRTADILVLGATGQLGVEIVKLLADNQRKLTVMVRATSREQLDALYTALSGHPMVKIVM